jgi:hypothetical protein
MIVQPGDVVFVTAHAQYRGLYVGISRYLKQSGVKIILFTSNVDQKEYYEKNFGDIFDCVVDSNVVYPALNAVPLPLDTIGRVARDIEAEFEMSFGRVAMCDRHLGRGFALGGVGHPRSAMSSAVTHETMLFSLVRAHEFWIEWFDRYKPVVFLNPSKACADICRKRGIEMRVFASSRIGSYYYWATDEYLSLPTLRDRYERIEESAPTDIAAPPNDHLRWRDFVLRQTSLSGVLKASLRQIAKRAWWYFKGYEKAKGYHALDEVMYIFRIREQAKEIMRYSKPLSFLGEQKFAYFPLHMEPEIALQRLSPEAFGQLSIIASLARDLPAGVPLVVKDTATALGRRPKQFYEQIADLKNVIIVDTKELGLEIVRKASVICTITGTAGVEAVLLGKPLVTFGRHNLYGFVPGVVTVTDLGDMRDLLRRAIFDPLSSQTALKVGGRFAEALKSLSVRLEGVNSMDSEKLDQADVAAAYELLLESLR